MRGRSSRLGRGVGCEQSKLLTENPRRVAPRVPKSETAGNCFVAWSRVELLTDRVERSLSLFDAYCG